MSDADRDGREAAERAAARRAFIRSAHPDRGGDPDAFIAGLRGFDAPRPTGAERPRVVRSRRPDRVVQRVVRDVRRRLSGRPPRNLT
ncbi:hypothetical protein [Jatrophihabitans fulvus]